MTYSIAINDIFVAISGKQYAIMIVFFDYISYDVIVTWIVEENSPSVASNDIIRNIVFVGFVQVNPIVFVSYSRIVSDYIAMGIIYE